MKAMILAAGRGERLRPLTDTTPKPLLKAGPRSLIEHHLFHLAEKGINDVVINIAWLGAQIKEALGKGEKYNLNITYSDEGEQALETAGGIIKALPLLGDEPFLIVNGDIWSDFDLSTIGNNKMQGEAHLVLVDNPDHNNNGDFALKDGYLQNTGDPMYTYSGIGIYTKQFFEGMPPGKTPLAPILREKIKQHKVTGEIYKGLWTDVGTIERLQTLNNSL
jgi:MurNAc alpha-1-phosphate uridylyltransferase